MKKRAVLLCGLLCALLLAACGGKSAATGWYLATVEGSQETGPLIVLDDAGDHGVYMVDKSGSGGLFDGLENGDRIRITYDCPDSSPWPGVNWVYKCELLEEGSLDDVPEEALTAMEEAGYDFGRHVHAPAAEPETVDDPVSGYCGNTVTKVTLDGETYSFWGGDSVDLTDILVNLAYDPARICRCAPEFTVDTEFGTGYGVNLTESYARCEAGQAGLTAEQAETIRGVLARNCGGVTVTQWSWDSGETQTFPVIGGGAAALTELLSSLDYSGWACDCMPEYTVDTAAGGSYGVNLSEEYARRGETQAQLTKAQAAAVKDILDQNRGATVQPIRNGDAYALSHANTAALADLLSSLDYSGELCKCLPEYTVTLSGGSYGVNLTEQYARFEGRQAALPDDQTASVRALLARAPG